MSLPMYLSLTGERQGLISQGASTAKSVGNLWQEGREDQILVTSVDHQMNLAAKNYNIAPIGQRIHQPFTITKHTDKSSPLLNAAFCNGELITDWRLDYYRYTGSGTLENYYCVKLTDARIVNIRHCSPDRDTGESLYPYEMIAFSYQRIDWRHVSAGTSGIDSWNDQL